MGYRKLQYSNVQGSRSTETLGHGVIAVDENDNSLYIGDGSTVGGVAVAGRLPFRTTEPDNQLGSEGDKAGDFTIGYTGSLWHCFYDYPGDDPITIEMTADDYSAGNGYEFDNPTSEEMLLLRLIYGSSQSIGGEEWTFTCPSQGVTTPVTITSRSLLSTSTTALLFNTSDVTNQGTTVTALVGETLILTGRPRIWMVTNPGSSTPQI